MDKPVYNKYHKEHMTFEEFVSCVRADVDEGCSYEPSPGYNDRYWNSAEWQEVLVEAYDRYSKSCKNETDWDLAVNAVMCEFSLMC